MEIHESHYDRDSTSLKSVPKAKSSKINPKRKNKPKEINTNQFKNLRKRSRSPRNSSPPQNRKSDYENIIKPNTKEKDEIKSFLDKNLKE